MASKRELRSAGSTTVQSLDSTKNYKLNTAGSLVESTGTPGGTEIVFSGSKSSLRRLADLERNVSILAAKALSDDGSGSGETGDVSYAQKAGKWSSARTITLGGDLSGSVSIDGSANVTLSATVAGNTVALGTDTTGNYMVNVSAGTGISVSHTQGEGSTATVSLNANTDNVSEGSSNLYHTTARARSAVSFTAGSGAYNSSTGVITIPTNTNQLTNGAGFATEAFVTSAVAGKDNTDEITEGSTNLFFTNARARSALSGSTGISYNSSTGAISSTITQYTDAAARGAVSFTAGSGAYNSTTGVFTIPTNTNQLTNGAGFITGYTETSTLAAVTGRGATTTSAMSTGALTVTGGITASGEITAYFSDERLKMDINPIQDALSKVMAIGGYTYKANELAHELGVSRYDNQIGLLAQEVEAVMPELVTQSGLPGYKTIRYDKVVSVLVEAIKEQQAMIEELRRDVKKTLH